MDLDRQAIERKDFPIGRRGYDPDAVDAHLRALAGEFEDMQRTARTRWRLVAGLRRRQPRCRASSRRPRPPRPRSSATRSRTPARCARRPTATPTARARRRSRRRAPTWPPSSRPPPALLERVGSMEGEVSALVESLRAGARRLAADLTAVESGMDELYGAAAASATAAPSSTPVAHRPCASLQLEAEPDAAIAAPAQATNPSPPPSPPRPGALRSRRRRGWWRRRPDLDGARLIALNMALNGESRCGHRALPGRELRAARPAEADRRGLRGGRGLGRRGPALGGVPTGRLWTSLPCSRRPYEAGGGRASSSMKTNCRQQSRYRVARYDIFRWGRPPTGDGRARAGTALGAGGRRQLQRERGADHRGHLRGAHGCGNRGRRPARAPLLDRRDRTARLDPALPLCGFQQAGNEARPSAARLLRSLRLYAKRPVRRATAQRSRHVLRRQCETAQGAGYASPARRGRHGRDARVHGGPGAILWVWSKHKLRRSRIRAPTPSPSRFRRLSYPVDLSRRSGTSSRVVQSAMRRRRPRRLPAAANTSELHGTPARSAPPCGLPRTQGEHLFAVIECGERWLQSNKIVVSGAREHNLKDISAVAAARRAGRDHRAVGLGQVEPRVRHDLRRGSAPLRRVAVGLRAPVPRPDGQARRRLDRGPLAGDLDRPEDHLAQPALDGRHGDRDLRLPAPAVGARGQAALPDLRAPDRRPVGRADRRPGDGAGRGHPLHGARAGRAGAQGRVRQAARRAARRRLRAREDRRPRAHARGVDRARQALQARHLGRRRPPRDAPRPAQAAGRLDRDRRAAAPRASSRSRSWAAPPRADCQRAAAAERTPPAPRARAPARADPPGAKPDAGHDVHLLRALRLPRARPLAGRARAARSSPSTRPTAPATAAPGSAR